MDALPTLPSKACFFLVRLFREGTRIGSDSNIIHKEIENQKKKSDHFFCFFGLKVFVVFEGNVPQHHGERSDCGISNFISPTRSAPEVLLSKWWSSSPLGERTAPQDDRCGHTSIESRGRGLYVVISMRNDDHTTPRCMSY